MTDPTTTSPTPGVPAQPEKPVTGLGRLALALSRAQGQFTNPVRNREVTVRGQTKTGKNFEYSFMYADLAAVLQACGHGAPPVEPPAA